MLVAQELAAMVPDGMLVSNVQSAMVCARAALIVEMTARAAVSATSFFMKFSFFSLL
jgi:hypothetical protein